MVQEIQNRFATTDGGQHAHEVLKPKPGLFAEVMGDAQKGVNHALNDTGKQAEFNHEVAKTKVIDFAKIENPMAVAQLSQDARNHQEDQKRQSYLTLTPDQMNRSLDHALRNTA